MIFYLWEGPLFARSFTDDGGELEWVASWNFTRYAISSHCQSF